MVLRSLALVGGAICALGLSQFPEYSQQYTQRLSGAVDELSVIVERFDQDARSLNLTRNQALEELTQAGGIAEARAQSMQQVFVRHENLSNDLSALRSKAPVHQLAELWRMTDTDIARKAFEDFKPAIPASFDGVGFGMIGFLAGWMVLSTFRLVFRTFIRRKVAIS